MRLSSLHILTRRIRSLNLRTQTEQHTKITRSRCVSDQRKQRLTTFKTALFIATWAGYLVIASNLNAGPRNGPYSQGFLTGPRSKLIWNDNRNRMFIVSCLCIIHLEQRFPTVLRGSQRIRDQFSVDPWLHFCNGYFEFTSFFN